MTGLHGYGKREGSRRNVAIVRAVDRKHTTDQNANHPVAKLFAESVKKFSAGHSVTFGERVVVDGLVVCRSVVGGTYPTTSVTKGSSSPTHPVVGYLHSQRYTAIVHRVNSCKQQAVTLALKCVDCFYLTLTAHMRASTQCLLALE